MVAVMVPAPTMDSQAPRHKEDDHADGATAQVTLDTAVAIAGEVASQDEGGVCMTASTTLKARNLA